MMAKPWLRSTDSGPFDLLFQPRYRLGKGAALNGYDLLLRQTYKDALAGDIDAIKPLLRLGKRLEQQYVDRDYPERFANWGKVVSAIPAMRLLGIAAVAPDSPREWSDFTCYAVLSWVVEELPEEHAANLRTFCVAGEADDHPYRLRSDASYRQPRTMRDPAITRFKPGKSGNPRGRPKRAKGAHFLSERMDTRINGKPVRITRYQNLLLQLEYRAAKGDADIRKLLLDVGMTIEVERYAHALRPDRLFTEDLGDHGHFRLIEQLRQAGILNARARKFQLLEPWIVERALARMAPGSLDDEEQAVVARATSTPEKVAWPDWWNDERRKRQRVGPRDGRVATAMGLRRPMRQVEWSHESSRC
jgi:hypothetical protein